jgi:hypothetical protein
MFDSKEDSVQGQGVQTSESQALPTAVVEVLDDTGLKIQLERLMEDALYDQGVATASGQGCISSPNGPTC